MGTYRKRGDTWRAEINKAGVRESKTFPTKREAQGGPRPEKRSWRPSPSGYHPENCCASATALLRRDFPRNKGHRWEAGPDRALLERRGGSLRQAHPHHQHCGPRRMA